MNFNDIHIFIEIANCGSVSKAAEKMNYVQSHLSKRLEKIEAELGSKLFIRTNRGMDLLPAGRLFLKHCHKIMQVMAEIETDFQKTVKTLQIGATQSITKNYLYDFYAYSNDAIFTRPIPELLLLFKQKQLDMLLLNRKIADSDCECEILFWEKISWMASNKNTDALFDRPIVVSRDPQCPYRKISLEYIEKHHDIRLIEVDPLDAVISLVEQDIAHAILPVKMIESGLAIAKLKSSDLPKVPIYQYMRREDIQKLSAFNRLFLSEIV
ncbi:LysR family transcriptional regulator [Isobaculum melis]|uniref:DNA-binding transcriptional regulator, LysR family n=1 Tax=Isobaculum melis TaxID=142588 RepID=A0A1H9PT25_9LACT|nr:LysR family transcriptional regulator [Isobaculum melis]SER51288.1 DNA-binding transcriptional regulator, LysR family [Isobaculum melis]